MDNEKIYQAFTVKLLEAAKPYTTGQPDIWKKQLGEEVSFDEKYNEMFKAKIPLMHGNLRTDTMVVHDIPTQLGMIHAVLFYCGGSLMPSEFFHVFPGRIPYPVYVQHAMLGPGSWTNKTGQGHEYDPFCEYMDDVKYKRPDRNGTQQILIFGVKWDQTFGSGKIKFAWTMQLVPFDIDRSLFVLKYPAPFGFMADDTFGFPKFYEMASAVRQAVASLNYKGVVGKAEMLASTYGTLAVLRQEAKQASAVKKEAAAEAVQPPVQPPKTAAPAASLAQPTQPAQVKSPEDPLEIARQRVAAGQMSSEDFEKIRKLLGG